MDGAGATRVHWHVVAYDESTLAACYESTGVDTRVWAVRALRAFVRLGGCQNGARIEQLRKYPTPVYRQGKITMRIAECLDLNCPHNDGHAAGRLTATASNREEAIA